MRHWAARKNGVCLSSKYEGPHTPLRWRCENEHSWLAAPNSIRRGTWCPFCRGRNPSVKDMSALASRNGGKLISQDIPNSSTKVEWECALGHRWFATPTKIKRGRWCPKCKNLKVGEYLRGNIEQMRAVAQKRGGLCLSDIYKDSQTKLLWQCKNEHQWQAAPANITRGQWCPHCSGNIAKTIQEIKDFAKSKGGECLSGFYKNRSTKLEWKCAVGHTWTAPAFQVVYDGTWCPICSSKISERICRTIFEQIFLYPFPSVCPTWLRNSRGNRMQLDGYCEKLGIAFEFQGPQHYKINSLFASNTQMLKQRLADDDLKKKLCQEEGINLVLVDWQPKRQVQLQDIITACKRAGVQLPKNADKIEIDLKDIHSPNQLRDAQLLAERHNGKCLSDKFIAVKQPLVWQCQKGHKWSAPFDRIKRGVWCLECAKENFGATLKLTLQEIQETARARGGVCLTKVYKNDHTKMKWQCRYGHTWEAFAHSIRNGSWCPGCAKNIKGSIEAMRELASSRGGRCLSTNYTNANTKLRWECAQGHIWEATPGKIKWGRWCPKCARVAKKKLLR